jgi:hypothetical protein
VEIDARNATVFASNADGTLTVIHPDGPDQYHVAQTITTPPFSRNLGLDPTNPPCLRGRGEIRAGADGWSWPRTAAR